MAGIHRIKGPVPSVGDLTYLQRAAGNAAVVSLIGHDFQNNGPTRTLQRVMVTARGIQQNLANLNTDDMLWYLRNQKTQIALMGGAGLSALHIADIQTWLTASYATLNPSQRRSINSHLTVLAPALIRHAARAFPAGTVTLSQTQIVAAATGTGKQRIAQSPYYVSADAAYLRLYHGDAELGLVRYSIDHQQIGVETINVRETSQGSNLSRVLMAAFCAYGSAHGATNWKLNTQDTSGGWWAQWGTTSLVGILARGDMQNVDVPQAA